MVPHKSPAIPQPGSPTGRPVSNVSGTAMHTIRLIYASDAREDLRYRDFMAIMDSAAETNRERAITGLLCYGGGQFLQALEVAADLHLAPAREVAQLSAAKKGNSLL